MELQNSKDWAKVYRACNFIEKGVCEYANERVYVSQEALQKSLHTMKGRPVIIDHTTGITPENMHEHAVGYVVGADHNTFDAGCDCQFVVFDDKGKEVIADGYSVSCAYKPLAFGPGGTWHNVPYDREIVELEFTHLALVQNPRYEDAKVYENSKSSDKNGRWITVHPNGEDSKGTHLFIKDGETAKEAIDRKFGKKEDKKQPKDYDQALAECQTEEEIREFFVDQFGDNKTADFYTRNELKLRAKEKAAKEKKEVAKKEDKKQVKDCKSLKECQTEEEIKQFFIKEENGNRETAEIRTRVELLKRSREKDRKEKAAMKRKEKKEAAKKEEKKAPKYSESVEKVKDFIEKNPEYEYYTVDDYGYVRAWKTGKGVRYIPKKDDGYEYEPGYWVGDEGTNPHLDRYFKEFLEDVVGEKEDFTGRYAWFTRQQMVERFKQKYGEKHNASEDKGRWITIKGSHIFIEDGQSVEDAIKQRQSSSTEKKEKGLEGKYKGKDKYDPNELLKDIKKAKEEGHVDDVMDFLGIEKAEKGTAFLGAELEGKYAEEDADFDPEQMKKDIKKAQSIGYKTVESIASFLGLDEDEVRETLSPTEKKDSNKQHKLQVKIDDLKSQENEIMKKYWEADEDGRDELQYKLDAIKDERLRLEDQVEKKTKTSFDEEGFKKFVEANKKKEAKKGIEGSESIIKDNLSAIEKQLNKNSALWGVFSQGDSKLQVNNLGSGAFTIEGFKMPAANNGQLMAGQVQRLKELKEDAQALILGKVKNTIGKQLSEAGLETDIAWDGEDSIFIETWPKEKHNSKEDTMNVEEFFNKMGEIIEEKFNACKGKMNEADEEEKENEDDDKFEMDGEVYSKKELVNAFKEKKNAEDEEEKEEKDEEEEKQNSNDEFFNAMEQRMLQYNKEEGDKVQVYTQQKGLERGKAIYGK